MEKVKMVPVAKTAMEDLFSMQKKLMEHYIKIEGLPNYPLDMAEKKSHKIIKDFKERISGELSEAYEVLLKIWIDQNDNAPYDKLEALEAFNEEVADALHFMLEMLVFSGIEHHDIQAYFQRQVTDNMDNENLLDKDGNSWLTLFNFAKATNMMQGYSYHQMGAQAFTVIDERDLLQDYQRWDCLGARKVSAQIMTVHAEFLWEITYMLNRAVNFLKQKDWAQTERLANVLGYRENIMETFLHFIRYADFMGQTPIGLFNAYYRKNQILQKRIKDGY